MNKVVGIDLGTTSSRVAIMRGRTPIIIENSEGEGMTPSCVAITEDGDVLVGEPARRQSLLNVENSIYAVKRLIGRKYDDPLIEELRRNSPYRIIRASNGDAWVEVAGQEYSPQ